MINNILTFCFQGPVEESPLRRRKRDSEMKPEGDDSNREHTPATHNDDMGKPEEKGDEGKEDKEGKGKGDKDEDEMVPFEGPDWGPKDFHFIEKTLNVVSVFKCYYI